MKRRRRFKQTQTLESRFTAHAAGLREQARFSSSAFDRDRLMQQARRAEQALQMNAWLTVRSSLR
jgi:hypothetical protein